MPSKNSKAKKRQKPTPRQEALEKLDLIETFLWHAKLWVESIGTGEKSIKDSIFGDVDQVNIDSLRHARNETYAYYTDIIKIMEKLKKKGKPQ